MSTFQFSFLFFSTKYIFYLIWSSSFFLVDVTPARELNKLMYIYHTKESELKFFTLSEMCPMWNKDKEGLSGLLKVRNARVNISDNFFGSFSFYFGHQQGLGQ